jgi:hypothetical protein
VKVLVLCLLLVGCGTAEAGERSVEVAGMLVRVATPSTPTPPPTFTPTRTVTPTVTATPTVTKTPTPRYQSIPSAPYNPGPPTATPVVAFLPPTATPQASGPVHFARYGQSNAVGSSTNPAGIQWWHYLTTYEAITYSNGALGGLCIAQLAKGTAPYATLLSEVQANPVPLRAVLYWQGECDASEATDGAVYRQALEQLALDIQADLGVPLVVAVIASEGPAAIPDANFPPIQDAQRDCWLTCVNVVAGPDFADQRYADGWHAGTQQEMEEAASRWYTALIGLL